jgi:hypothetical protein
VAGAESLEKGEERAGYAHAFTIWCVLPQDQSAAATAPEAAGGGGPSRVQLARLRVLQVSLFGTLVGSFMEGVGMFDNTFLLGPMHFLQEEKVSINIFGKVVTVLSIPVSAFLLPWLGPYRAVVIGGALGAVSNPVKVLPWCGSQCQLGPYVAALLATVGGAISGPASIMYLASALKSTDLAQAQSALLVVNTVIANVAPMIWSAFFFGTDRASLTTPYLLSACGYFVVLVAVLLFMPRALPKRGG